MRGRKALERKRLEEEKAREEQRRREEEELRRASGAEIDTSIAQDRDVHLCKNMPL